MEGAIAATVVGWAAVAAGWGWGAMLIVYFVASTLVSRAGRAAKHRRTASIVAKGGERDAVQVLANGGVFAVGAVAMLHSTRRPMDGARRRLARGIRRRHVGHRDRHAARGTTALDPLGSARAAGNFRRRHADW